MPDGLEGNQKAGETGTGKTNKKISTKGNAKLYP